MEVGLQTKKLKVIGLIPTRLGSTRLPAKALLPIGNLPLIIHTYRRAKLSKLLDDVIICCDNQQTIKVAKKFKAKCVLTSLHHKNGGERIAEYFQKQKTKYDLVLDIQGDEPLISPYHIDDLIRYHKKNQDADIILPTLKVKSPGNQSIIKVVTNKNKEVMYLSRSTIPFDFKNNNKYFKKHLSIISFKPSALIKFSQTKETFLEKIEGVELLRALEIGLKIKSIDLKGDSFSVDEYEDYLRAKDAMKKDLFYKKYK